MHKFELSQTVAIAASGETGQIISRAEYINTETLYLIRYTDKDGEVTEKWWGESALQAA